MQMNVVRSQMNIYRVNQSDNRKCPGAVLNLSVGIAGGGVFKVFFNYLIADGAEGLQRNLSFSTTSIKKYSISKWAAWVKKV